MPLRAYPTGIVIPTGALSTALRFGRNDKFYREDDSSVVQVYMLHVVDFAAQELRPQARKLCG